MGYWISEDDENTFESKEEMVWYVIENEDTDWDDFWVWLDETYCASDTLGKDEYDFISEFNEWQVDEAPDAEEGESYEYGGYTFDWVEEEEEEEEEEE